MDGQISHLHYHQQRLEKSFQVLFSTFKPHNLAHHLFPPQSGRFRVRIIYDATTIEVAYLPYETVFQQDFILIDADFTYDFKYLDRECFDVMKEKHPDKELIFCKNGYITDTAIANIACLIEGIWYTPKKPLLEGTTRARLLDQQRLRLKDITVDAFKNASSFALMNALTDFYEVKNATISDKTS